MDIDKLKVRDTAKLVEDHSPEDPDASYNVGEYDREGDMAKDQLRIIADAAQELYNLIKVNDNLPEWVQKKITLATDYIDTVRDYMKANAENYGQPEAVDELDRIKQLGGIG
jgi:serine protease inhibitor